MPTLQDTIEHAKSAYLQSKAQLCSAFAHIPEERLKWSPSPAARNPIHIVAHSAMAVRHIQEQMAGTPFRYKTTAEADAFFREMEQEFTSREQVIRFLDEVSTEYLTWLDGLTQERLESMAVLPFGLGTLPVEAWLTAAPNHTSNHAAQLEYIQTLLGDRDWYL